MSVQRVIYVQILAPRCMNHHVLTKSYQNIPHFEDTISQNVIVPQQQKYIYLRRIFPENQNVLIIMNVVFVQNINTDSQKIYSLNYP